MGKRKNTTGKASEKSAVKKSEPKKSISKQTKKKSIKKKEQPAKNNVKKSTGQKKQETKQGKKQITKNAKKSKQTKKKKTYYEYYNTEKLLSQEQQKDRKLKEFLFKLEKTLTKELLIPSNAKIILAVSGGVDSVVMLDAMFQIASKEKFELLVCHYNHKLRGISADKDEKFVKRLASSYGIKFYSDSGDVKKYARTYQLSIEQAARTLRYMFFERLAGNHQAQYLMTAHTADDSAETVLLNLLRGSGLTGLSGIPARRPLGRKAQVVRPFLVFKKNDLTEYAELRKLKWREDETNTLVNFTRNKIRHHLLPELRDEYNPQIVDTLNRTSKLIRLADEFVKEHLTPYLKNFKWNRKKNLLTISIPLLQSCGEFIQGEILQVKLRDKFHLGTLPQSTLERIIALPELEVGSIVEIGKDVVALRERNHLLFYRNKNEKTVDLDVFKEGEFDTPYFKLKLTKVSRKQVKLDDNPYVEYFDYDLVPAVLKLRNWEKGDTFVPLGMKGKMKISDFLINEKVSLPDKKNIIVLSSKNNIIWICGKRINDNYKITSTTTRFLKGEWIAKEENNE